MNISTTMLIDPGHGEDIKEITTKISDVVSVEDLIKELESFSKDHPNAYVAKSCELQLFEDHNGYAYGFLFKS